MEKNDTSYNEKYKRRIILQLVGYGFLMGIPSTFPFIAGKVDEMLLKDELQTQINLLRNVNRTEK